MHLGRTPACAEKHTNKITQQVESFQSVVSIETNKCACVSLSFLSHWSGCARLVPLSFFQQPRYQMLDCIVVHVFKMHRRIFRVTFKSVSAWSWWMFTGVVYLAEIQIHMLTVCNRSQTGQVSAGTVCTVMYSSSLRHPLPRTSRAHTLLLYVIICKCERVNYFWDKSVFN